MLVETVYAHFRSKTDLLMAAVDVAVVGDTQQLSLSERPEFLALGRGTRKQRARAGASLVAGINQRIAGVYLALREGAASDPDLAERLREGERRRRVDVEEGATLFTGRPVGREVCDGLWAVLAVDVYQLLTDLRRWSQDEYETWLADVVDGLLRRPA